MPYVKVTLVIERCIECQATCIRKSGRRWWAFCTQNCRTKHKVKRGHVAYESKRRTVKLYRKKHGKEGYIKSASSTIEEDLAWMKADSTKTEYNARNAFEEDGKRRGRRTGGAGARK